MPVEIKMPALSPTMEQGTIAKWLVKEGDSLSAGDLMAEIETDKATMEFEAVDEGTVAKILIPEGTENVNVGAVIAMLAEDGEDLASVSAAKPVAAKETVIVEKAVAAPSTETASKLAPVAKGAGNRIIASPLAKRIATQNGVDLAAVTGSGPNGRIVKADVEAAGTGNAPAAVASIPAAPADIDPFDIPHEIEKLSGMRKTIARRLTESKQQTPHIYLTVDINIDKLLKLRGEINTALEPQGIKLSVNDLLIKALGKALVAVPACNVSFAGNELIKYSRADISVAVSIPGGLITPIVKGAEAKSISEIATEMKDLAARAKDGKLQPEEYQGGTASLSNMGMFGIKQFDAVINPPQAMIMAISAGLQQPAVVDGALSVATIMSATGSFDHRAIDGADGAELMKAFKNLVENPLGMLA